MRSPLPRHPAPAGSTCNAVAGSTLAILHPTTRYAAVQAVELRLAAPGAAQLAGPWLWRLPASCSTASGRPALQQLVGSRSSVPKEQVYPRFDSLAKLWAAFRDELSLLQTRQPVLHRLSNFHSAAPGVTCHCSALKQSRVA